MAQVFADPQSMVTYGTLGMADAFMHDARHVALP